MEVTNKILVVPTGGTVGKAKREKGGFHSATIASNEAIVKRKKVTFDLDLQIHTIPNRIPFYEKRPASNRGPGDPLNFIPRQLDLKGRDRFEFGDTTATPSRIIDLFAPVNSTSFANSSLNSFPARTVLRNTPSGSPIRSLDFHRPPFKNAVSRSTHYKLPTRTSSNYGERSAQPEPQRLSRAAENLREITAELRDHFESAITLTDNSYYPENGRKGALGSRVTSALPATQRQPLPVSEISIGLASRANNKPPPKSSDAAETEFQQSGSVASMPAPYGVRPHSQPMHGMVTPQSMTPQSHALRRVPVETSRRPPPPHSASAVRDSSRQAARQAVSLANVGLHLDSVGQQYLPGLEAAAAAATKPFYGGGSKRNSGGGGSSRFSTIDTYVISDVNVLLKNSPVNRQGTAKKRILSSPNKCWSSPSEDDYANFSDPLLASNLPSQQLQISSRPPNVSNLLKS